MWMYYMKKITKTLEKIFSIKKKHCHKIINICGLHFRFKIKKIYAECQKQIAIQDSYDLSSLLNANSVIVFLVPRKAQVNGGIMSIFSLCRRSRELTDSFCMLVTFPGNQTHAENTHFENSEKVYRWSQFIDHAKAVEKLILQIPEFYVEDFYAELPDADKQFLQSIPSLHINILNQNILLMPKPEAVQNLIAKLTTNVSQTTAHSRYATQEVCDTWRIPTHLLSVQLDHPAYKYRTFDMKEKIIALSPDTNEFRSAIVSSLEEGLPDFEIITIHGLTFGEYMDFISRAFCTITFGEGMDAYFLQPPSVGSVAFAVYNADFFPDKSWADLDNIYSDYEQMGKCLVDDINKLLGDRAGYERMITETIEKASRVYSQEGHKDNMERFYQGDYDFYPTLTISVQKGS